ncbi:VOC family protein [Polyangium aurulentum]|uniref:VOC family protein n=1 Tax=Polyangium aurulentum TaxID=2567896 RepID=UPI0010AE5BF2|nr:VOC family protein [Polyangium aurulentum]UQA57324.1 VOC family protein [Polyangium aurulentum]
MITAIKFLSIPIADPDRAIAFYRDKLGFELVEDQPMGGGKRWITLRIPGAQTEVVLFTPDGQEDRVGSFLNASFTSADVQQTFELYTSRGVTFTQPPKKQPWGGTLAIFKDSEGNTIVLSGA